VNIVADGAGVCLLVELFDHKGIAEFFAIQVHIGIFFNGKRNGGSGIPGPEYIVSNENNACGSYYRKRWMARKKCFISNCVETGGELNFL
jgi:hypothetical protein